MCICKNSNRQHLQVIGSNVKKALQSEFSNSTQLVTFLIEGNVVVLFYGRAAGLPNEEDYRTPEPGLPPHATECICTTWMHVGYHQQSPWTPTWYELTGPHDSVDRLQFSNASVKSSLQASIYHRGLLKLDPVLRWDLSFFSIQSSPRMLCSFDVGSTIVEPYLGRSGGVLHLVWDPSKKPKTRAPSEGSWNVADISSVSGSDEDGDRDDGQDGDPDPGEAAPVYSDPEQEEADCHDLEELEEHFVDADVDLPSSPPLAPAPLQGLPPLAEEDSSDDSDPGSQQVISLPTPRGKITYYPKLKEFYMTCSIHGAKCRKTRTAVGNPSIAAQGRPVGYLMAWADMGTDYDESFAHRWGAPEPTFAQRSAAREWFRGLPSSREILKKERKRDRTNEGPDPLLCP